MKKVLFIFIFSLLASSCDSIFEKEPVGIGSDYSELKRSPCACLQLDKKPGLPEWMRS